MDAEPGHKDMREGRVLTWVGEITANSRLYETLILM